MERQLTFIDVDENRLELWLKPDRVQLVVIDSRPELEAGELRRFASVVFAEYVARDLSDRLAAARRQLEEARDRARGGDPAVGASSGGADSGGPAVDPAPGALIAALDGALRAIDDLTAALVTPEPLPVPVEVEPEAQDGEAAPVGFLGPAGSAWPAEPAARPEPIVLQFSAGIRRYPLPQALRQASPQVSHPLSPQVSPQATRRGSRKRSRRSDRAKEASVIRWGGSIVAVR